MNKEFEVKFLNRSFDTVGIGIRLVLIHRAVVRRKICFLRTYMHRNLVGISFKSRANVLVRRWSVPRGIDRR